MDSKRPRVTPRAKPLPADHHELNRLAERARRRRAERLGTNHEPETKMPRRFERPAAGAAPAAWIVVAAVAVIGSLSFALLTWWTP